MLVLTVLKSGGVWTPEDVEHLNFWVSRYSKTYFSFVCLTDLPRNAFSRTVKVVPLLTDMQGWWAKTEIFRKDLPPCPVRWYMDLDVVPIKVIKDMYPAKSSSEFLAMKDLDGSPFSTRMLKWTTNIDTHDVFQKAWRYWVDHKLDESSWPTDRDKVFVEDALGEAGISFKYMEDVFPDHFAPYSTCHGEDGVPEKAHWLLFENGQRPKDVSTQWYIEKTRKVGQTNGGKSNFGRS
jgi:hypothetical protein